MSKQVTRNRNTSSFPDTITSNTSSHNIVPTPATFSTDNPTPEPVPSTIDPVPSASNHPQPLNKFGEPAWCDFADSINSTIYPYQEAAEQDIVTLQSLRIPEEVLETRVRTLRDKIILYFKLDTEPIYNNTATARYETPELAKCVGCEGIGLLGNLCTEDQCIDSGNIYADSIS